jgi:hypothetical protein
MFVQLSLQEIGRYNSKTKLKISSISKNAAKVLVQFHELA